MLSELIKYTLNTKKYIVSIPEELEATKKYIEIEKIKLKESFDVEWDVDDNVLNQHTMKFILHPIIENAIMHGIKYLDDKKGIIKISIKLENNILNFVISNNGPKIPLEKLQEVTSA